MTLEELGIPNEQINKEALLAVARSYKHKPNGTNEDEPEVKEAYIQKHTNGALAESVVINGMPWFVQYEGRELRIVDCIESGSLKLKPLEKTSYLNKEYEFSDEDEIRGYFDRAKKESLDSLYGRVRTILFKYIDADSDHLNILTANICFTYFQDKIGQTHYLMFVGDTGTGKSNSLTCVAYLGYRPLYDTSITPANIYSYLGSIEEGQGIILEDEADNIDTNPEKMKIYKVGYNAGKKVSRLDISYGRKQQSFWTYCFKAFTAEREPDKDKAKGFLERTFVIHCSPGNPRHDISEVINPAGDEKYEALLAELTETRKLLLCFRLLHYGDPIPDIELSVKNREKQLCKPLLRLFQNAECRHEIGQTLARLLAEKREIKANTFEAKLYHIMTRLVSENGLALENGIIYSTVKEELNGEDIPGKSQSFYCVEHGVVSLRQILKALKDKFGANSKHDGKNRLLLFNSAKLARLKTAYEMPVTVEILSTTNGTNASKESTKGKQESEPEPTPKRASQDPEMPVVEQNNEHNTLEINESSESMKEDMPDRPAKPLVPLQPLVVHYCGHCNKGFETAEQIPPHSVIIHPEIAS